VRRRLLALALAALLAPAAAAALLLPRRAVVTVDAADGRRVAAAALPASGRFELRYRHSYYGVEAVEWFQAAPGGGFRLVAVGSPSQAVLDYYGLAGRVRRDGRWLRLELDRPQRFRRLPLVASGLGRRTLVVGADATALAPPDGGPAHLVLGVQRRPWLLDRLLPAGPR
jgi:hypothetical protein